MKNWTILLYQVQQLLWILTLIKLPHLSQLLKTGSLTLSQTQLHLLSSIINRTRTRVTLCSSKMWKKTKWLLTHKVLEDTKKTTILKVQSYYIKLWDLITSFWDQCLKWMGSHIPNLTNGTSYGVHQTASHIYMKV